MSFGRSLAISLFAVSGFVQLTAGVSSTARVLFNEQSKSNYTRCIVENNGCSDEAMLSAQKYAEATPMEDFSGAGTATIMAILIHKRKLGKILRAID